MKNKKSFLPVLFISLCLTTTLTTCSSHRSRNLNGHSHNKNPRIGLKRIRQEQLCPLEYQACFCDYTNVNNDAGTAAAQENSNRLQLPASASHLSSATSSASFASSLSFSIMIDCQFYIHSPGTGKSKTTTSNNKTSTILTKIPRIQTSSSNPALQSNKFKYLSHITHLDLSRTAIAEVQTDAFYVRVFFVPFYLESYRNLKA